MTTVPLTTASTTSSVLPQLLRQNTANHNNSGSHTSILMFTFNFQFMDRCCCCKIIAGGKC